MVMVSFTYVYGNVENSGLIDAGYDALYVYAGTGGNLTNSGTILSEETGIYIRKGDIGGDLTNSGIIYAYDQGISLRHGYVLGNVTN